MEMFSINQILQKKKKNHIHTFVYESLLLTHLFSGTILSYISARRWRTSVKHMYHRMQIKRRTESSI